MAAVIRELRKIIWPLVAFALGEGNQLSGQTIPWLSDILFAFAGVLIVIQVWPHVTSFRPFANYQIRWPIVRQHGPRGLSLDKFLYVGQINVFIGKLASESLLEIQILGFNGSSHRLRFDRIDGVISYSPKNGAQILTELPPLQFTELHWSDPLDPYTQFCLNLVQRVSVATAAEIAAALVADTKPELKLLGVSTFFRSADKPILDAKLPLWGGMNLTQCGTRVVSNKITYATMQATI